MPAKGAVMLVANYSSDVGYAWWLMENFWAAIAHEIQRQGRRCLLAYPEINSVPDSIREAPIELLEIRLRPRNVSEAIASARLLRRHGVTSVYLTDWPGLSYVYVLWRLVGVKSIVLHDHTPGARPRVAGFRGWIKSAAYQLRVASCDTFIGVSDYIRRRFIDNWRVPPNRCLVVRNGIREFSCSSVDRAAARREMGVAAGALLVVLVSRATYYKGWDFALRTLSALLSDNDATVSPHFVFCGTGPDLEAFRRLATELKVAENAHFLGHRTDVRTLLCCADIALHPSKGEALSLSTLEFMCAGLPVVVPDNPTVCGVISHGSDGLIYPADDIQAAAAMIRLLAGDAGLRRRLGESAKKTVLSGYRLESTIESFKRLVIPRL